MYQKNFGVGIFLSLISVFSVQSMENSDNENQYISKTFVAKENGVPLVMQGDCDVQNPPCSTFKIALALIGFDSGILKDKNSPTWTFKEKYQNNFQSWYKPEMAIQFGWTGKHTPETFMKNSVIWFSHKITKKLGKEAFQNYVNRLDYGNKDVSGTPGQDDGLLNAWLETSLKISPQEQVTFIEKMIAGELSVSSDAQKKTLEIMVKKDADGQPVEWGGWKVFGKTGGGTGCNRWFVGWVEKNERKIVFAQYVGLTKDTPNLRKMAPLAIDEAEKNLLSLISE